jgi:hypothetical protein
LAFNFPSTLKARSRAEPSTLRSGPVLELGLVLKPTATSSLFSQTTKRYPMMVLGVSSFVEKKFFGRPSVESSIRTSGIGAGSTFLCPFEHPKSAMTATTTAAKVLCRHDLLMRSSTSTFTLSILAAFGFEGAVRTCLSHDTAQKPTIRNQGAHIVSKHHIATRLSCSVLGMPAFATISAAPFTTKIREVSGASFSVHYSLDIHRADNADYSAFGTFPPDGGSE